MSLFPLDPTECGRSVEGAGRLYAGVRCSAGTSSTPIKHCLGRTLTLAPHFPLPCRHCRAQALATPPIIVPRAAAHLSLGCTVWSHSKSSRSFASHCPILPGRGQVAFQPSSPAQAKPDHRAPPSIRASPSTRACNSFPTTSHLL